jgi:outer membrane protein OmpA-like peptidoglycan-associated protein/tetratricopeptide (TPR) repeat protein
MKRTITQFLLICFLSMPSLASAQVKKADEAFKHHHYDEAIALYEQAIRRDLDNDHAITNMAIALWRTNRLLQAEYWFTRAALMNEDPEVKLMFAQVLIANEKYGDAAQWLTKYMAVQTDDEKLHQARQLHAWCTGLEAGAQPSNDYRVQPLEINSTSLDFAPFLHKGKLYLTTNRKGVVKRSGEYDPWTGDRFTDVFEATRSGESSFGEPVAAFGFPAGPYHEGPLAISADGRELFLTTSDVKDNSRSYDEINNTRLRIRHYLRDAEGIWIETKALPFCKRTHNVSHPAISPDGRTLIFASDMAGGRGGMDLYAVTRNDQGEWSEPQALGAHINTRGNDVFPSFDRAGNLYYASNGLPGFGGLDLFFCALSADGWALPENMGKPINGPRDDFGLFMEEDGLSGFFTSNRNPDNQDDILYFKRTTGIAIEGELVDCATGEPIAHAKVELHGAEYYRDVFFTNAEGRFRFLVQHEGNFELIASHERYRTDGGCTGKEVCSTAGMVEGQRTEVKLALSPQMPADRQPVYLCGNVVHGRYGNPLAEVDVQLVDPQGEVKQVRTGALGSFFVQVDALADYTVQVSKAAFVPQEETVIVQPQRDQCHSVLIALNPDQLQVPEPLRLDVKVEKGLVLELYHVYFDLASAALREDALPDLETFYQLMVMHPGVRGEIMAHTDARAAADYNLDLSQRRAEAVFRYLVNRGIAPERLTAKGYGETQPVNHCIDGVECTEEQHQRNRRVEFRILEVEAASNDTVHEQ